MRIATHLPLLLLTFANSLPTRSNGSELSLVKDINVTPNIAPLPSSSDPAHFSLSGSSVFFSATARGYGRELWKSDGTEAGTIQVKDIYPGSVGSYPESLTAVGNNVFFRANDGSQLGDALWRSDGTEAGTVLIKVLSLTEGHHDYAKMTAVGGTLFFEASDCIHGFELWKSDGTPEGTSMVKELRPGQNPRSLDNLTAVGDTLFFTSKHPTYGEQLWKSDGTATGTVVVETFGSGSTSNTLRSLKALGNTLFFSGWDNVNGQELWKSDGTAVGTVMVKNISLASSADPSQLTVFGDTLFFRANTGLHDTELWKSDGTEAGTVLVKDIVPGGSSSPEQLRVAGDLLFFTAYTSTSNRELWKTDGTEAGTVLVRDIHPGNNTSNCSRLTAVGDTLYFNAISPSHQGPALWKSDGTEAGTVFVKSISLPESLDYPVSMMGLGGSLLMRAASTSTAEFELWKSEGTTESTIPLKDINYSNASSNIQSFAAIGDTLYFSATSSNTGQQLWKSVGNSESTVLVKDITPGSAAKKVERLTTAGNTLFFVADDIVSGSELWKSDGSEVGTVLVKDIITGNGGSSPDRLTAVGNNLYFVANDGVHGKELWRSDGTEVGTALVKDLRPGSASSNPTSLTAGDDVLYFVADDGINGSELWKSDGTPAGTVIVKNIFPGMGSSNPDNLIVLGDTLFFTAFDGVTGRELWKSDGTSDGTVLVKNIGPGIYSSEPRSLTVVGSHLFFTATDGSTGRELWKSDGTESGTHLVKDVIKWWQSAFLHSLTAVGSDLFFLTHDEVSGHKLWKSDGSKSGTIFVTDIPVGTSGSFDKLSHFTALGDILYFMANDAVHAWELWRSDGTDVGTFRLSNITGNSETTYLPTIAAASSRLFFSAYDEVIGGELWSYLPSPDVTLTQGTPRVFTMTLKGIVNPNGFPTSAQFEYGLTPSYGSSASVAMTTVDFASPQRVFASLEGLTPDTLYHYRLTATNIAGHTTSQDGTFVTQTGPEVEVLGNNTAIENGDAMPSVSDATDFGTTSLLNAQVTRTFTVQNIGSGELYLAGAQRVTLGGQGAADFTVLRQPESQVAVGGSTTFDIRFDPKLPGMRTATITLASNDPDSPYTFTISGLGGLSKPQTQTITFTPPSILYHSQIPHALTGLSSSGLPVSFEILSGSASLNGNIITEAEPGTIKIRATQAGAGNVSAAPPVTRVISIKHHPGILTLINLRQTYTGTPRPVDVMAGESDYLVAYEVNGELQLEPPTQAGLYFVIAGDDMVFTVDVLHIEKAPLYVKVRDKRKFAGQPNPTLMASQDLSYTGFVNGEDERVFTRWPTLKTTATTRSPGGLYPITASSASAANYRFIYQQGTLVVDSFTGAYEALLFDEADALFGKLTLTVPATSTSFTGKFFTSAETITHPLKGTLFTQSANELATGSATVTKDGIPYVVNFSLPLVDAFSATVTRDAQPFGSTTNGRRLLKLKAGQKVAYRGAHTVHMQPASPTGAAVPEGAGWATATFGSSGTATLAGKLPDGVSFTSTLSPDDQPDPTYRWFARPYLPARVGTFIGGHLTLAPHPDLPGRRYVAETAMTWVKAERAADHSYRAGFGPVSTLLTLDPWLPPARGISLLQRLGIAGPFDITHSPASSLMNSDLPTAATLSLLNKVTVTNPASNLTKWKLLTLSPTSGKFTGSFELNDNGARRSVPFSGVLRQPASTSPDAVIGNGHYLLPALPGASSNEKTTGELLLERPAP